SAAYCWASAGLERYGFNSVRRFAYNYVIPRPNGTDYIVREKFELLRAGGHKPEDEKLTFPWFENHTGPLVKEIAWNPILMSAPLRVVLSPTHRRTVRQWPKERFVALANELVERYSACVYWLWGPNEEDEVRQIQGACRRQTYVMPP